MQTRFRLASLGLLAAATLSACVATGNLTVNTPKPSSSPSAGPSAQPSASPSAQGTPEPTKSPQPTVSASASVEASGKLKVTGADVFNKYTMDFRTGMKWVYGMTSEFKMPAIEIPGNISIPGGGSIPGLPTSGGSGGTSTTDLGELTIEVIKVEGDLVTMRSQLVNKLSPAPIPPSTTTFEKKNWAAAFAQATSEGAEGTVTWTAAGSESVKVAAGSYSADIINGVFDITALQKGIRSDLDQVAKVWVANGVGMVKEEVKSNITGSGSAGSVSTDTTTHIQLKSFSR